jgi:hypothetical protein
MYKADKGVGSDGVFAPEHRSVCQALEHAMGSKKQLRTESEIYALTHRDIAVASDPKRLIITIRKGKTGHPAAVSVYARMKSRNKGFSIDDFIFLLRYKNRSTAKQIIQRQFNSFFATGADLSIGQLVAFSAESL